MIIIEELQTKKCPGITSLFVNFKYNADIVAYLKSLQVKIYDKDTKIWEIPITELSNLIINLSQYDKIKLKLFNHKEEKQQDIKLNTKSYKLKPFDYQVNGIKYGLSHNKFLLLDAPGLGKSAQILHIAEELKKSKKINHCLIICGINTLKSNWQKEIEKHTNLDSIVLGQRVNSKNKIVNEGIPYRIKQLKENIKEFFVITNIESLRDKEITKQLSKGKNKFDMIIFDEVHKAKNPTAVQSANLLKLKADYLIGATGTILTNSPEDCYMPLKWLGVEKSNFSTFKAFYYNYGGPFNNVITGFKNMKHLKYQLEKYSLRRTKDLLDLPPKTVIDEYVDMNDAQAKFYDNIKQGVIDEVDKVHMSTTNLLAMVARLRQATACPSILTSENIESSKIIRCCELCDEIISNGNKVVVFSTFKDTANEIFNKLKEYKPLLCTGDIKDDEISKNIDKFQKEKENKVIVCTWQKMGTGVTLTAATYAIFVDCPWTSADYIQAQDRIYRIGTKNAVTIYNLIAKNTIDERVREIVQDKRIISDYVVDDKIDGTLIDRLRSIIMDLQ